MPTGDEYEKRRIKIFTETCRDLPYNWEASTEIINLQSILNLPKGTEHFMSDLHGEYQAFSHVLRNGSGAVRKKIDDVFGHTLGNNDKRSLATLVYYPREKMDLVKETEEDMENWYKITLYRLIEICKTIRVQVHQIQGTQGTSGRLCLCVGRTDHRESRGSGQRSLL